MPSDSRDRTGDKPPRCWSGRPVRGRERMRTVSLSAGTSGGWSMTVIAKMETGRMCEETELRRRKQTTWGDAIGVAVCAMASVTCGGAIDSHTKRGSSSVGSKLGSAE